MPNEQKPLYIASTAILCPLGNHFEMVNAAITAGITNYSSSETLDLRGNAVTTSPLPEGIFDELDAEIFDELGSLNAFSDMTKMALATFRSLMADVTTPTKIPLIISAPKNVIEEVRTTLRDYCPDFLTNESILSITNSRASGITAINTAFQLLEQFPGAKYIAIGAADSLLVEETLDILIKENRTLAPGSTGGAAPGEGSAFLLLTPDVSLAKIRDNHVFSLSPPGIHYEQGYLNSNEAYTGQGLHLAFKHALKECGEKSISRLFSSMNGENYWSKELGVSLTRNQKCFHEKCEIHHPAEYFGDLGSAIGPTLIGLALETLSNNKDERQYLISCSADDSLRSAITIKKNPYENARH